MVQSSIVAVGVLVMSGTVIGPLSCARHNGLRWHTHDSSGPKMTVCCAGLAQFQTANVSLPACMRSIAKIHTIFEGTSEIQQLVIARAISGLRIE